MCKFYGYHPSVRMRALVPQGGNQCGLICEAYAPCRLEIRNEPVDFEACELRGSARHAEFDQFEKLEGLGFQVIPR